MIQTAEPSTLHDECIERFLQPLTLERFEEHYRARRAFLFERPAPGQSHFTMDELEEILTYRRFRFEDVRVFRNGKLERLQRISLDARGGPVIDNHDLLDRFDSGATIVLENAQAHNAELSRLCFALSSRFRAWASANVYITPPGASGLPLHFDDHHVVIAQISGTKRWHLEADVHREGTGSGPLGAGEPAKATELTLKPGDVLFLPEGTRHRAWTTSGASAHVTISLVPITVAELLARKLRTVEAAREELYRVSESGATLRSALAAAAEGLARELRATPADDFDPHLGEQDPLFKHPHLIAGRFRWSFDERRAEATDVLQMPRELMVRIVPAAEDLVLAFQGKELHFAPEWEAALFRLSTGIPVAVRNLPCGAGESERLQFATDLVRCGAARIA